jgi:hypothetical protein
MKIEYRKTGEDDTWEYSDCYVDEVFSTKSINLKSAVWANIFWFLQPMKELLIEWGINLNDENLKQLESHADDFFPSSDIFYRICAVCEGEPDQNLAMTVYLANKTMPLHHMHEFLAACRQHGISGSRMKGLLQDFTKHWDLTKLDFSTADTSSFEPILNEIFEEHKDKIAKSDPTKITNFIVGQAMKKIIDKKTVDVEQLRAKITEKMNVGI